MCRPDGFFHVPLFSLVFPVAPKLCDTLSIIQYQVGELNNTDKASRELYYHCVQDVIHQAILLFPIYVQHTSKLEASHMYLMLSRLVTTL